MIAQRDERKSGLPNSSAGLDVVVASAIQLPDTVAIQCGYCSKIFYVPKGSVRQNKILAENVQGAFVSPERNLYCSKEHFNFFCED